MVSKKLLGVAIAAALSAPAFADVVLDASSPVKVKVAKTSLATKSDSTNYGSDYYTVTNGTGTDIDLGAKWNVNIDVPASGTASKWVRLDLTNAIFTAAPALTVAGTNTATIIQGGLTTGKAAGRSSVVFKVTVDTTGTAIAQTDTMAITLASLGVSPSSAVGATIKVYSSEESALAGNSSTAQSVALADVVTAVDGFTSTFAANTKTADVEFGFKKIKDVAFGTKTELGSLKVETVTGVADADGTGAGAAGVLGLGDAVAIAATKSKVTLSGDFSNADYSISTDACATDLAVITSGSTDNTTDKKKLAYTFDLGTAVAAANLTKTISLCVSKADNANVLNATAFTAAAAYDKLVDFTPAAAAGEVGTIVRNGTTIQVPFVSTFADYKQRLVLVNRGSADVAYNISFTPEAGTTATANAAATGTLAAGKTTVLNSTDVVALTGATTRTAATITVVSSPSKIDAATTMVNVSDKSTDTVKLTAN